MSSSDGGGAAESADVIFEGKPVCVAACGDYVKKYHWRITTNYIEMERGICCKSIDNIQLLRVKDVSWNSTCCCAACGVITVHSSDATNPTLKIGGLPNGSDIFHKLRDAVAAIHQNAKLELGA